MGVGFGEILCCVGWCVGGVDCGVCGSVVGGDVVGGCEGRCEVCHVGCVMLGGLGMRRCV